MESKNQKQDEVLSAMGSTVKKGDLEDIGAPEVKYDEVVWGEKIGDGCFGSVFKGKCRGMPVAIKRLKTQTLNSKALEDFRKEVDIMTQMRHPNVVLFMGACTDPNKMCIISELMADSVFALIHRENANENVTLAQRVKMAKDTAAGMAWLHGANPQIIHRDLKPQNLLVDEHWNVKVCDFGLSQVKMRSEKIRDGKSIPGTPLWMAPEVLLGKDVDEKADVYSYGIVLWEIITGKEPFTHHDDYAVFKDAITVKQERPPMDSSIPTPLRILIEASWDPTPSKRPYFTEIMATLDNILIDCMIDDQLGQAFWKKNFLGKSQVPWGVFASRFSDFLGLGVPSSKDLNFNCLKKILAEPNMEPNASDADAVKLEKFGHWVNWFGPIVLKPKSYSIMEKMRLLMQKDYFHGDTSKEEAEDLLAGQPKGTFLVRVSYTNPAAPFTISKVSSKGHINHQRIQKHDDGTFEITKVSSDKKKNMKSDDDLMTNFIKAISSELGLATSCPGSKYKSLFLHTPTEGYLNAESDDD